MLAMQILCGTSLKVSSKMQRRIPLVWLLGLRIPIQRVVNLGDCVKRCNLKSWRNKQGLESYFCVGKVIKRSGLGCKRGRNKAVGPDQIPVEAWRSLGVEGIRWLTNLFNKIFTSAKMPQEWRLSDVIPIFKNKVEVGLHQGLAISSYIFTLILDELSRGIQKDIPWCFIFADDIVLVLESAKGLNNRHENLREALKDNGLRVNRKKTEYLRCDFVNVEIAHKEEAKIYIGYKISQPKESFRYLKSMIHKSRRIDEDVAHRIKAARLKSECWPITKALATRMEVAELRMLRWTCSKTMLDMIPDGVYRAELEMETIINKMRGGRLRWFGHARRRPQSAPVRRVKALVVDGLRRRGRLKLRWEDRVKLDMKELLLSEDMTSDRNE
nr:hypothetical protein [Tanacetum cinerariifolium]